MAIVSLLAGVDAERPRRGWPRRAASSGARVERVVRLGVERRSSTGALVPGDVEIADGRIAALRARRRRTGSGSPRPGFVDLQVNGFGGVDFLDADADGYARAGEALLETGVTAYLPTLITAPEERARRRARARSRKTAAGRASSARTSKARSSRPGGSGRILPPRGVTPTSTLLERLLAAGPVRLFTLAPELPGALDLVDLLVARGVTVSRRPQRRDRRGGERRLRPRRRAPSPTSSTRCARSRTATPASPASRSRGRTSTVQIILDGAHLAPDTVRLVWRAAAGRLALVTDAVAGGGRQRRRLLPARRRRRRGARRSRAQRRRRAGGQRR